MKDDLVERLCGAFLSAVRDSNGNTSPYIDSDYGPEAVTIDGDIDLRLGTNAVLAIARPAILEEAAAHLKALSDAMWEKADHVAPEGFEPPTAEERDSAVMAYDFQKAAECVLSLAHTAGQEGGR